MALGKVQAFGVFALGLLLMAYSAEAHRLCSSRSKNFHGPCKSHKLCATVCYEEHFTGGHCSHRKLHEEEDLAGDVDDDVLAGDGGDDDDMARWKKKSSKCICVMECSGKKPSPSPSPPDVPSPPEVPQPPEEPPPPEVPQPPEGPQPPTGDKPPARKNIN